MIYSDAEIKKMQTAELDILVFFDSICRLHHLRYSLIGGTLIGAIRNQGFIPWDDDIDVAMPRPDYRIFCSLFQKQPFEQYFLENSQLNANFPFSHSQLMKKGTIALMEYAKKIKMMHGIFVDVFPFDYEDSLDDIEKIGSRFGKWNGIKERHLLPYGAKLSERRKNTGFKTLASKMLPRSMILHHCVKLSSNKAVGGYCVDFTCRFGLSKGTFSGDLFDSLIEKPFEGRLFFVFANFDLVLRQHYGDYMKLPPKSEQVGRHQYIEMAF